jgi:hypothetical protein
MQVIAQVVTSWEARNSGRCTRRRAHVLQSSPHSTNASNCSKSGALAQCATLVIPVSCNSAIFRELPAEGSSLNITAMLTLDQVETVAAAVDVHSRTIVSVFAGRIADTGIDPVSMMARAVEMPKPLSKAELLWATRASSSISLKRKIAAAIS